MEAGMNDEHMMAAARAAYDASHAVHGTHGDDRDFKVQVVQWLAIARAAVAAAPRNPEWPLRARVWTRTRDDVPQEKVLEIEGTIGDTHMNSRHTQSLAVADADVPGLPEHYPEDTNHPRMSVYAEGVAERHGAKGLESECRRLLHKIDTAASLHREGRLKSALQVDALTRRELEEAVANGDTTDIARILDKLQDVVVKAQRIADPHGLASLVLHVDEDKWQKYPSYAAYMDALRPKDR